METYSIYHCSSHIPKSWDDVVKQHDIFLQLNYLKALEASAPNNIQLFYLGVFKNNELVGLAVIQRVQLYLKDMFRKTQVTCAKAILRTIVSKVLKGNILVVGNLTHTGQHGMFFNENKISKTDYYNIVFKALNELKKQIKSTQNKTIRVIMFKDYFVEDAKYKAPLVLNTYKFRQVSVQPNMIMPLRSTWLNSNDYVLSLNKKYRDRYKRARRKLSSIKSIELDLQSIGANKKKLHSLYLNVSNNAKFNTFVLPENHFYALKQHLKDNFRLFAYYLDGKIVGFYTLILNGEVLETYFLGYDSAYQYTHQLYLNMLYDMLKFGIENNFKAIVYARTAMAIKSSVGAKPKAMLVYIKHTNGIMNTVLKPVFSLMDPTQKWEERHPFKQ